MRDEPIPHKNFTLLGQGSNEIPGEGSGPWYPMWVPIPLVTEGLNLVSKSAKMGQQFGVNSDELPCITDFQNQVFSSNLLVFANYKPT